MAYEANLYNPAEQSKDWLIEHFVVRTKVFGRIFEDVQTSTMEHPEQHYLIQAQRGMGKTTLLLRLKYEIEKTEELKNWLIPVFFNEESYDLTSLSNLWEKLLKYFDDYFNDGGNYYDATEKYVGSKDYEQKCFNLVTDILHKHKKKIVILFDNFGELFLNNLKEKEGHRFREILMTSPDIRIIAGSAVVLESNNDYKAPFFDFFKIINLEGLNKDETLDLIKKLQEKNNDPIDVEANKARIETLTILTGGVIRTIIMLYEILLTDKDGTALKDLNKILDRVTPLYKHRMEDLKPQQRRIMDVIAKNWDAMATKDIAKNIRDDGQPVPSKVISAQLQELEKNNLVEKRATSTKNNLYIVKERFFNIWYLMRHGDRTTQCKVKWLTRFLEMWYGGDSKGMDGFIREYLEKLKSGNYISSSALTVTNALLSSTFTNDINQALLLHATQSIVSEEEFIYLLKSDKRAFNEALVEIRRNKDEKAIETLEKIAPKDIDTIVALAICHIKLGQYQKAKTYLSGIINVTNDPIVLYSFGLSNYFLNETDVALPYLLKSINAYRREACFLIGDIYHRKGEYDLAESYFLICKEYGDIQALYRLSSIYFYNKKDAEKAINAVKNILELDPKDWEAWRLLGGIYPSANKSLPDVAKVINKSIELNPSKENKNIAFTMLLMAHIHYRKEKVNALKLAEYLLLNSSNNEIATSFVFIWNNAFDIGLKILTGIINSKLAYENDALNDVFILLMSKNQCNSVLKIFNENAIDLKEKLKPTYYALMQLLKNDYPDEHIKMGKELEEPVKDILNAVKQFVNIYA